MFLNKVSPLVTNCQYFRRTCLKYTSKMEVLPSEVYQNIDAIAHAQDGSLAVASSSMTDRIWNGSLWIFKDASTAPDPEYSSGRACTEAGMTGLQWLDSCRIVAGLDDGSVEIWAQSGSLPGLENLASLTEHDDIVSSVSVDCAKMRIISGSQDRNIKLWDLNSEQCLRTYKGHGDSVTEVDCSRTEQELFLSASEDGSVVLWDTRKAKPAKKLSDPTKYESIPYCLAWSPLDSSLFATGFEDGSVHVYSIKDTTKNIFSYTPHTRAVNKVAFSPRSPEWLASISDDKLVHVQNVINNIAVLRSDLHTDFVRGLSWSPLDDSLMTSGWDKAVLTHMCGLSPSSDLHVEYSKSRNTSVISVDSTSETPLQVNGEVVKDEDVEDCMEVVESGVPITNGEKACGLKMDEIEVES